MSTDITSVDQFTGLLPPSKEERQAFALACSPLEWRASDVDWEKQAENPQYDPNNWGQRIESQRWNDCRANGGTSSLETLEYWTTGQYVQRSRILFYAMCEAARGHLGRDQGTTLQSGWEVMRQFGACREETVPYKSLITNRNTLNSYVSRADIKAEAAEVIVRTVLPAPPFAEACALIATRTAAMDFGSYWPWKIDSQKRLLAYKGAHGRGGHAQHGNWLKKIDGKWYIETVNSHSSAWADAGVSYMSERAYEEIREEDVFGMAFVSDLVNAQKQPPFWSAW